MSAPVKREPMWRRYLRLWRPSVRDDVDDELRFHFDERIAELSARGLEPDAARAQAHAEFGDVEAVRGRLRAIGERRQRRRGWRERTGVVWGDAAYAVRSLARAPTLVATVVLTLALGLGANGAIFSLVDRVFFRPPAGVAEPDGVRRLYLTQYDRGADGATSTDTRSVFNYPEFLDLRAALGREVRLAPYFATDRQLGLAEDAPKLSEVYAGADYFTVLGVRPALGRLFNADEMRVEVDAPVVVLSDAFWRRRFGGDSDVVGRTIELGRVRVTVVGVTPPGFAGVDLDAVDVWRPIGSMPAGFFAARAWYQSRNLYVFRVLARPAPDADARQLEVRATTALRRGDPGDGFVDTTAVVSTGPIIAARSPSQRPPEVIIATRLAGVALVVLLIACANVANLLLARAVQRRREIAVRLALGVRAGRLRMMLLTEGVLLALGGGAAALVVAALGGAALRHWLLPDVRWPDAAVDTRVIAFIVATAVGTGLLAALAPALRASRPDLTRALKAGAREGTVQRSRLRASLAVVQAALSVVLLVGAGLFVRSLWNVQALDIGYDAERLSFASPRFETPPDVDALRRRAASTANALTAVAERLARSPGVERVALATAAPMYGFSFMDLFLPGRDSLPKAPGGTPAFYGVSPEYFAATGLRIGRGRPITAADRAGAPPVIVVNAAMARAFWPGEEPLGQCVHFKTRTGPCYRVVGVVEDAHRDRIIEKPTMMYYLSLGQLPNAAFVASVLVIRAAPGGTAGASDAARRELRAAFPDAEPRVRAMTEVLAPELRPWRLGATLFSLLGGLALAVAAVGVYSTLAYTAGQRTHEFGVRVALGARARDVLGSVLRDGLRTAVAGVVAGAVLALAAGRLIASQLYGVSPHDPAVLAAVVGLLLGVVLLASLAPAWRASRVAPTVALRDE